MSTPLPSAGPPRSVAGIILGGAHVWREDAAQRLEPRLLLPVANVPLVFYTLRWLRQAGIADVVICVNEAARVLRRQLGDGAEHGLRLHYYVDRLPRGPGGCLRDAGELVEVDDYVIVEGSVLPHVDLTALLSAHRRGGTLATLVVHGGGNGDAPPDHAACPAGIHVFSCAALPRILPSSYQDIKETLVPRLLREACPVAVYPTAEPLPRISDRATYLDVQGWALERACRAGDLHAEYVWHGSTALHPTVRVAASARVIGPALVGAGTRIADRALLIGPVVVGRDCALRADVLVTNSVLWDGAVVEGGARVDACVVAAGALVPARSSLRGLIWPAATGHRLARHPGKKAGSHG